MKNAPIGVRYDAEELQALERAASADDRKVSAKVRNITVAWLRQEGWLPPAPPAVPAEVARCG